MMKMKGERRRSRKSMASHTGNEPSLRGVSRVQHQGRAVSIPSTRMRFGFALLRRKSAVKSHLLVRQQESKQPSNHQSAQSTESKHRLVSDTVYRPQDTAVYHSRSVGWLVDWLVGWSIGFVDRSSYADGSTRGFLHAGMHGPGRVGRVHRQGYMHQVVSRPCTPAQ